MSAPSQASEQRLQAALRELRRVFKTAPSKHEAHALSAGLINEMLSDREILTAVLRRYVADPTSLNALNYPVVGISIEQNPWFHLVANCWIPLPNRATNISTKAIHHHGDMLLTTATVVGPGYEHWVFTRPEVVDAERGCYSMRLATRERHRPHHPAFVDAWTPHLPVYPERMSITACLWSSQHPTTWLDHVKRIPWLSRHARRLRVAASRLQMETALDLKMVRDFDFYPVDGGFQVMEKRIEHARGPNADHLRSVFHVLQETGNEGLAQLIEQQVQSGQFAFTNPQLIQELVDDVRSGQEIPGRLSDCHLGVPHMTFTTEELERKLATTNQPLVHA